LHDGVLLWDSPTLAFFQASSVVQMVFFVADIDGKARALERASNCGIRHFGYVFARDQVDERALS